MHTVRLCNRSHGAGASSSTATPHACRASFRHHKVSRCSSPTSSLLLNEAAGPGPSSTALQAFQHHQSSTTPTGRRHRRTTCSASCRDTPAPLLPQSPPSFPHQSPPTRPTYSPLPSPPPLPTFPPFGLPSLSPSSGTSGVSGDLRLGLWLSLLQASAAQLTAAAGNAATAVSGAAVRLQRLSQPPPPAFPAGPSGDQTLSLLSDPLAFLRDATAQYGTVVGLLLGGELVVLVSGREEARTVLVEEAGTVYVKEGTAFFPGSSLAGNGLLVSDGPVWQRQRRLSNPAFRRTAVEAYANAMVAATADMLDTVWGSGGTRDVYADFNELTLRVTLEALFGFGAPERHNQQQGQQPEAVPTPASPHFSSSAASSEDAQQIVAAVEKAFMFFTQRAATGFVIPEWLPTWDNLEFAAAVQQLDRVVYGMIARRREELTASYGSVAAAAAAASAAAGGGGGLRGAAAAGVPSDLLTALLLSQDEDGSGMTDSALRDELMTLLVAGQETSAILLGWAAALLAAHPEVQARAAAELRAVCGQEALPTAASVRHMPYLESIVLETLRLYSPAYMVGRCARVDATLGPYNLPAGTTILVSPYIMHRDPTMWVQSEAFLPERWQEQQSREGYQGYMSLMSNLGPNGAYLPFGGGPRNCIGTGFAMMEAMLVLAAVLQRYDLALPPAPTPTSGGAKGGARANGGGSEGGVAQADGARGLPTSFPRPKPLLTLRPEAVVLRLSQRAKQEGR